MKKKTVKQAVLEVIIKYYPKVPNHKIAFAHPNHKLSGTQRFRELKLKHRFDCKENLYYIYTPFSKLQKMLNKERGEVR